jgi:hypothetical protein
MDSGQRLAHSVSTLDRNKASLDHPDVIRGDLPDSSRVVVVVTLIAGEGSEPILLAPWGVIIDEANLDIARVFITSEESMADKDREELLRFARECAWTVQVLFTMMNIKNASNFSRHAPSEELNAARTKRGKPPLQSYTYVHLLAGAEDHMASGGESEETKQTRAAHVVRGHFKNRKTGVYWWNAHVAGAGEVKHRDAYIVKGTA